jgi:hypothetical protein
VEGADAVTCPPVPTLAREPTRIGPGELLAALGEDLEPGRAAEVYAALGYPVLPCFAPAPAGGCTCRAGSRCDRPGKHPRIKGGVWQATCDLATVRRWWRRWPMANVAIRTGPGTFDVADIDGPHGVEALRAILPNATVALGSGPLARTGGDGWHLLFRPTGLGCPAVVDLLASRERGHVVFLKGLDWRGLGGYVLVWPSHHPSGQRYRWIRPLRLDLPEVPAALQRLLEPPPPAPRPPATPAPAAGGGYGAAALAAECARVRATPRGARGHRGRNAAVNRAAFKLGQLVHAGLLDETLVRAELLAAAVATELTEAEAARTIDKALQAARRKPPTTSGRRALLR